MEKITLLKKMVQDILNEERIKKEQEEELYWSEIYWNRLREQYDYTEDGFCDGFTKY